VEAIAMVRGAVARAAVAIVEIGPDAERTSRKKSDPCAPRGKRLGTLMS